MVMEETENLIILKDTKGTPDIVQEYSPQLRDSGAAIVIDNGSYQCRVGWASYQEPSLIFKNVVAKPRKDRSKKDVPEVPQTPVTQVGNDITNIEAVRFQLKTQFDRNIVTHFEAQEQILDYVFCKLGINTENCVQHPIVMTEAFLNPNYCRQLMSELLFECYNIPGVTYGIDANFSCYQNKIDDTCLIINCGYHTTHIVPVVDGNIIADKVRRINVGGFHIASFLHRLLQLKYPVHGAAITLSRIEEILHNYCFIACDYLADLKLWMDMDYYDANVKKIQLPFTAPVITPGLTQEQQKERKKELARRLMEINARKREERLAEDEELLEQLLNVQDMYEDGNEDEYRQALDSHELQNTEDLLKTINLVSQRIERTKQKIVAANTVDDNLDEKTRTSNVGNLGPSTSKSGLQQQPMESEDITAWLNGIKKKRQDILEKKSARKQRRQDMAKRRTVAAQERMRIISQLARNEKGNDDFGMRDEDWDVYKTISRDAGDSDSEAETERLLELEEIIRQHEPNNANGENQSAEAHQLHLGVELLRVPELLFQPSMIGLTEAGIAETVDYVFKLFDPATQLLLANNVFLTGGCACFPGIRERLQRELREMRPFETKFNVHIANKPNLDAWYGARSWASSSELPSVLVTRAEYDEKGGEYLKKHFAANSYFPTPEVVVGTSTMEVPIMMEEV
ncbi:actin-related protein 5 [Chrysoperla carnea]|uniref:actin-related protein 5 n=1 Tax=Chrysoperla carnea TaxID=189513 RepID=UPI001D0970AA|nr:actin-related protein 5 [Chrysoperla carnea]